MTESAANVFRDYNTPGNPGSGEYRPEKELLRAWGAYLEAGANTFRRVRVCDTGGADPDTAYEAGDVIDGVTLAEDDLVLRATPGGDSGDGVYEVPASGVAGRAAGFDSYNGIAGAYIAVMEGGAHADTVWQCTSNAGGTLDMTAIVFAQFGVTSNGKAIAMALIFGG